MRAGQDTFGALAFVSAKVAWETVKGAVGRPVVAVSVGLERFRKGRIPKPSKGPPRRAVIAPGIYAGVHRATTRPDRRFGYGGFALWWIKRPEQCGLSCRSLVLAASGGSSLERKSRKRDSKRFCRLPGPRAEARG